VRVGSGRGNASTLPASHLSFVRAGSCGPTRLLLDDSLDATVALAASSVALRDLRSQRLLLPRLPAARPERQRPRSNSTTRRGADRRGRRDRMDSEDDRCRPKGVECAALLDAAGNRRRCQINSWFGSSRARECLWAAECSRAWHSLRSAPWSAGRSAARTKQCRHDLASVGSGFLRTSRSAGGSSSRSLVRL